MAYCGIICHNCQAIIATQNNDTAALKEVAQRWGEYDNQIYTLDNIRCNGCRSTVLNKHCNTCEIRACGLEKELGNCGMCSEFICDKLRDEWDRWHDSDPVEARRNLGK